jgi:hypothetical protein
MRGREHVSLCTGSDRSSTAPISQENSTFISTRIPPLRAEEERTYFTLLSEGKRATFREEWAGTIALISNLSAPAEEIYDMWKGRGEIEKAFHVLQNLLDTDTPYVRQEETSGVVTVHLFGKTWYHPQLGYKVIGASVCGAMTATDNHLRSFQVNSQC